MADKKTAWPARSTVGAPLAALVVSGLLAGAFLALSAGASGCGGSVAHPIDDTQPRGGAGGAAGVGGSGAGPSTGGNKPDAGKPKPDAAGGASGMGGSGGMSGSPPTDAGGEDALPDYEDPMCPDVPPKTHYECDHNKDDPSQCPPGEGCYPFVQYPPASDPCGQEVYGAVCHTAGSGKQGDPCSGGGCAPGHVCVISGQGVQCVKTCDLSDPNACDNGLVCASIDIPNLGGCI